jgi:hypothetical protein
MTKTEEKDSYPKAFLFFFLFFCDSQIINDWHSKKQLSVDRAVDVKSENQTHVCKCWMQVIIIIIV